MEDQDQYQYQDYLYSYSPIRTHGTFPVPARKPYFNPALRSTADDIKMQAELETLKKKFYELVQKNNKALGTEEKKIRSLLGKQTLVTPTNAPSETVLGQLGDQYNSADKVEKNKILNEAAFIVVPGRFQIRNFFSNLRNRFFPSEEFKNRREQFRKIFEKEAAKAEIIEGVLKDDIDSVKKGLSRNCFDKPSEFSLDVHRCMKDLRKLKLDQDRARDAANQEIKEVERGLSVSRKRQQRDPDDDALRWHLGPTHQKAHKNRY